MNSGPIDSQACSLAFRRLHGWLETVRGEDGWGGPVVSFRSNSLAFTGAGNDWRLEGILDAARVAYDSSGDVRWLDEIEWITERFLRARRRDGQFENSYFEWNPFEGGMPHEPAVLAAGLRAGRVLEGAGRSTGDWERTVEDYLERVLLSRLWNKSTRFVRDWEISDFQFGNATTTAAALDLLIEAARPGDDAYREALAAYLLRLQVKDGALAGGIASSNRRGAGISPFYAARCLRPLRRYAEQCNSAQAGEGADRLAAFLLRQERKEGGFRRLVWPWRAASINPLLTGAVATVLAALEEDGKAADLTSDSERWLLDLQAPHGAFRNAIGFGQRTPRPEPERADWRDWIASAGWQDKMLYWLALKAQDLPFDPVASEPWSTPVRVKGRKGILSETREQLEILREGEVVYRWVKGRRCASVCGLS